MECRRRAALTLAANAVAPRVRFVIAASFRRGGGTFRHAHVSRFFATDRRGTRRATTGGMVNVTRMVALLSLLTIGAGGAAIACGGSTDPLPNTQPELPEVVNPATGASVRATVAAASLGDNSANVQIAFFASEATAPASVAVTNVILVNATTGATIDTLQASTPAVWNGSSYETWNEKVTPGGDLRASYSLTAPKWSSTSSSYSIKLKLRITLSIDGAEVTIESENLQREPQMVT